VELILDIGQLDFIGYIELKSLQKELKEGCTKHIGQLDFIGNIGVGSMCELEGSTIDNGQLDFIGYIDLVL
jgi:hypothetical protein